MVRTAITGIWTTMPWRTFCALSAMAHWYRQANVLEAIKVRHWQRHALAVKTRGLIAHDRQLAE